MTKKRPAPKGRVATSIAPVLLLAVLGGSLVAATTGAPSAQAQARPMLQVVPQAATPNTAIAADGTVLTTGLPPAAAIATSDTGGVQSKPAPPGQFDNVFTLADVGVPDTIVLRGVDAYHTINFAIAQNQVVKTATLHLRYHFSPGLLPALSHLKVSLNGSLFATLPVVNAPTFNGTMENDLTPEQKLASQQSLVATRNENNALLEATLTLPAELLVHDNEITFEFIGHYTLNCEDPSHSTLWSHVDSNSAIELAGSLLPLQNDLKLLPLPFYDLSVNLHPSIPIVFLSQPSSKGLQAAGIVASYFGILTDYRPVRFPVSFGTIPTGNAILISESSADLPAALNITGSSGPTVAMRANPSDPYSKVLVLTGDNVDDLLTAARALTTQQSMLAGDMQRVSMDPRSLKSRSPDDADRWLRTTGDPITVGQISQQGDLQGDGSVPVGVYSRVPPDLYYGAKQNLAFQMYYRYNAIPLANESTLQVYMNGAYVSSTPMPHNDKASNDLQTIIPVPVVDMRPFSNSMMLKFVFQIAKKGRCQDTAPLNLQGAIRKDSYLNLQNIPHWATLPNLEIFANAGYPFTRMADLSETAVVLPDTPTPEEIEMYLTFMGHFGAQTGDPVLNVTVTNPDGMKSNRSKDYLVMGTVDDIGGAIDKVSSELPVKIRNSTSNNGGGLQIQDTQGFFASMQHAWWKVRSSDHVESGKLEIAGGLPDAMIEGIEWPKNSSRSVVLIALRDKTVVPSFLQVFLKTSQSSDISQSVSVLNGTRFTSYRIGSQVYHVGYLGWWIQLTLLFSEFPWLIVVLAVLLAFLMAALLRAMLRRHARRRLQGVD